MPEQIPPRDALDDKVNRVFAGKVVRIQSGAAHSVEVPANGVVTLAGSSGSRDDFFLIHESLTAPQFVALCTIHEMGVCSITDIVKATAVDQATMRGVVERLKSKGWISQGADETDRRKVVLRLTESGQQLVQQMVPCAVTITEQTMGNLNPAERVALIYLLQKMNEQPERAPE